MQGEVSMKRFRLGLAGLAVLVGLVALALAGPASAFHTKNPSTTAGFIGTDYRGFDPMEASIPYLAWRGEEIRLVKCFRAGTEAQARALAGSDGEWQIIDWSGDEHVWPRFFDDVDQETDAFVPTTGDQRGRVCWAIDITSHKPGIAVVKLKVDGDVVPGEGDPVLVHQFNVIWMTLDQAILRNLAGGTGGPAGPITEFPGQRNRLGVVIKGRVPLNEQFRTELGRQRAALNTSSIVLPDAWVDLANTSLASISRGLRLANNGILGDDPVNPTGPERALTPADFWDIHDSTGPYNAGSLFGPIAGNPAAGGNPLAGTVADVCPVPPTGIPADHLSCHVSQVAATAGGDPDCNGTSTTNDTVDNCDVGELSTFSRVFHDVSGPPTIGPYSPTRPDETVLSDSLLNLHDAPMPSALVVANIAPNVGGTDIGGVGSFSAVDKHVVYNRGGTQCPAGSQNPHCLTAPFYASYIPPSPTMESNPAELPPAGPAGDDNPDTASGIHGAIANDFEGYQPVSFEGNEGLYHFWDIADIRRVAVATSTLCPDPPGQGFRQTPSGPQSVALYTDEHGEAQFQFNAGLGFFFNQFIVDRTQGACLPVGLLGTANITVDALYPFQPVTHAGITSNPILKRIESLFQKGIICVPKPGEEQDKVLCVAFGRDIDGTPLIGERVCVTALGDAFIRVFNEAHFGDQPGEIREGDSTVCARLHANPDEMEDLGTDLFPTIDDTFAIETFLIIGRGSVRVIADFRDERLEFGLTVTIPAAAGTPGGTTGASIGQVLPLEQQRTPVPIVGPGGAVVVPTSGNQTSGSQQPTGTTNQTGRPLVTPTIRQKASLVFVRIVKPMKQGVVRSVVLRVKSPSKTARLQIKLIGKRGKVLGTLMRKVKTNRTVKVPNLRLPKAVVTVRVKVIA
jgi:hypothetical protein